MVQKGMKTGRDAKSGRFTVAPDRGKGDGEGWKVLGPHGKERTVHTSKSSAAKFDEITVKHRKALKSLAKK